jgi:hypothetical protein
MRRLFGLSLGTGACLAIVIGASASASSWGPVSSYYKGSAVVTGYGTFTGGTTWGAAYLKITDPKNDGNTVYGRTNLQYKYYNTALAAYTWTTYYTLSIPEFANSTVTKSSGAQYVPGGGPGLGVRSSSQVCAQMGWPVPDSCVSASAS